MTKTNWSKIKQPCFVWGRPDGPGPSREVRKAMTDPDNPKSHYHRVTGNRRGLRQLARFAEERLGRHDHDAGDKAFALTGPSSCGKNWTAESHARVLGLPFCMVAPEFKTANALFDTIRRDLERQTIRVVKQGLDADQPFDYVLPPCVVFLDEAHAISMKLQKGVLLKAIDKADRTLTLSDGSKVCTSKVHWIAATTHFYTLFKPLRTRFEVIKLVSHTKVELAEMVKKANKELPVEVCERIAFYSRLPRECNGLVGAVRDYSRSDPDEDWATLLEMVARDKGIDELGLYVEQVAVLSALGNGPVGKDALPSLTAIDPTELESEWLPGLLVTTSDMQALVMKTPRGYVLTPAGREELAKRQALLAS
jgi:Holliday junction resolvasome RuvABC ATP-dependent DNA helicase subunit